MRCPSLIAPSSLLILLIPSTNRFTIAQTNDIVNDAAAAPDDTKPDTCISRRECSSQEHPSHQKPHVFKSSKLCPSHETIPSQSLLEYFYNSGMSAQAYKPHAPPKTDVCRSDSVKNRIARNPFWRTSHRPVPMIVHANFYSCSKDAKRTHIEHATMEVWQPRPDGKYSSLRKGVEDGDCRATIPLSTTTTITNYSNNLANVHFETVTPGSPGLFGGLVPSSSSSVFGDHPPYGPGKIHFLITIDEYYPLLAEMSMNNVADALSRDTSPDGGKVGGRFHFHGSDWRPHAAKRHDGMFGGMEIRSATMVDSKIEVEVDFYVVPMPKDANTKNSEGLRPQDLFCSSDGGYFDTASFFKEPISVCYPSLLDFFAL